MSFKSKLRHFFVRDSLRSYSENLSVEQSSNPIKLHLNDQHYSVHVSYVHDSGNKRENPDEMRIQISSSVLRKQSGFQADNVIVAFIGFYDGGKAFVAWEPTYALSQNPRSGGSIYARLSHQDRAIDDFAGLYQPMGDNLGRITQTITLRTEALGFYLENIDRFHSLQTEQAVQNLIQTNTAAFMEAGLGSDEEIEVGSGKNRQKFTYLRAAYPRDPKFRDNVMSAYGGRCCICDRQLGIVQAAHIIPHREDESPNTVQNGLAMCIEHHELYDAALLLPAPEQKLFFNVERAEYLCQIGQGEGLDGIEKLSGGGYSIPENPDSKPLDEYLQRGLEIRMGN